MEIRQGTRIAARIALTAWLGAGLFAAEPALEPVRVCDVVGNLAGYEGKAVAVVGRFSFRDSGRSLSEDRCGDKGHKAVLRLVDDSKLGPKPHLPMEIDAAEVDRKLKTVKQGTALGKFRFGSPDYDRWAIVYGRVEAKAANGKPAAEDSLQLFYRGDGVVVFLDEQQ